jgi:hypothetical protein
MDGMKAYDREKGSAYGQALFLVRANLVNRNHAFTGNCYYKE